MERPYRGVVLAIVAALACAMLLAVAAQAAGGETDNPFGGNAEAITEGEDLFDEYCSECHGDGTGGSGPSLIDEEWTYGGSDSEVYDSIANGRAGGMPTMSYDMEKEEIWKTIAFLRSIEK